MLRYHPDKQAAAEIKVRQKAEEEEKKAKGDGDEAEAEEKPAEEDDEDEMFKAITEAFEVLSDVKRRRDFDSLDDFDDSIPTFKARESKSRESKGWESGR